MKEKGGEELSKKGKKEEEKLMLRVGCDSADNG